MELIDLVTGLGGTSLLNANVFLRADEKTMGLDEWPEELNKKGALDLCTCGRKSFCTIAKFL